MLEVLKKNCKKSFFVRIIITIVIIVGLGIWKGGSIFQYIKGPTAIGVGTNLDSLEGKYVTYNAKYLIDEFIRKTSKNSKTNVEKLTDIGYLVYDVDNNYFLGILVNAKTQNKMNQLIQESWDWMNGDIENVSSFVAVTGTLEKLTGQKLSYFNETVDNFISEEMKNSAYAVCITDKEIDGMSIEGIYVIMGALVIAILYFIYICIRAGSNQYDKNIKKYLTKNTQVSLSDIESDFNAAQKVTDKIWVGKRWTIFTEGMYAKILPNDQIVWAYYYKRTGKNSVSRINTYCFDKTVEYIQASESVAEQILGIYQMQQPHIVIGYSKEIQKDFDKDYQKFLQARYYPSQQPESAATEIEREDPFAGI